MAPYYEVDGWGIPERGGKPLPEERKARKLHPGEEIILVNSMASSESIKVRILSDNRTAEVVVGTAFNDKPERINGEGGIAWFGARKNHESTVKPSVRGVTRGKQETFTVKKGIIIAANSRKRVEWREK